MKKNAFINQRKKDVTDFLSILARYSITYGSFKTKSFPDQAHWGYSISDISFSVDPETLKHIQPAGFTNVQVVIDLDVESLICEWDNLNDPFSSLYFNSLIRGTNPRTGKTHYLGFHLDRHDGSDSNELHPLYHLHYIQNNKVKAKNDFDHGDTLQLDVPRLMHLPMELILGVSTILSNFSPKTYSKLVSDRQFIKLCQTYQEKIWRPYFNSLENYWLKSPVEWNPQLICPYLV